jgi:hypothetical protein
MATRVIVTSQPDVACDVCARRLLRGEQSDTFLAAGRRRTVCELCAPRAAHEGWMRETDTSSMTLPPMRPRRGRSLIERFRQGTRAPGEPSASRPEVAPERPYDLFGTGSAPAAGDGDGDGEPLEHHLESAAPSSLEQALAVFNDSEFPRRVAGVARSLGAPTVNVRSAEHHESVVNVVVAWELSWYRYEIDLSESPTTARSKTQGTELDELEHDERAGNAVALENGLLALAQ